MENREKSQSVLTFSRSGFEAEASQIWNRSPTTHSWSVPLMPKAANAQRIMRGKPYGRLIWQWKGKINIIVTKSLLGNIYKICQPQDISSLTLYQKGSLFKVCELVQDDKTFMNGKKSWKAYKLEIQLQLLHCQQLSNFLRISYLISLSTVSIHKAQNSMNILYWTQICKSIPYFALMKQPLDNRKIMLLFPVSGIFI